MKPSYLLILVMVVCSIDLVFGQSNSHQDQSFVQEYHDAFIIDTDNPDANDIRSVYADTEGNVWAATKKGTYRKASNARSWTQLVDGSSYDVEGDREGYIWVAAWDGVYSNVTGKMSKSSGPEGPIAVITSTPEGLHALGPHGIWRHQDSHWEKVDLPIARSVRAALPDQEGGLWIGTDVGLYHCREQQWKLISDTSDLLSAYVQDLDYHPSGDLWVGGLGGVTIRNEKGKQSIIQTKDGLPNAHITAVRRAPDGIMWVGTAYGISRFPEGGGDYSVRHSKRWLLSDEVRDIAFDKEGHAWIATAGGVSCIRKEDYTLEKKAQYFYDRMLRRNKREPWIIGRFRLLTAGDTTTIVPDDDDNDGEYNAMYLAMESFRYATTGEEEAKERARKSFDFLHFLREVTESDGFFARTIIPVDWEQMHDPNRTYTEQQLADELIKNPRHKPVEKRWHISSDGKWKWKGDTSSDELCGHLFGYYSYYELAADEGEKKRIVDHVSQITDHLIRNDFYLVDLDGQHTKWGVWSPQSLNDDPDWAPERALNSLEILSWLKFAAHISGNIQYEAAYQKLITEEGYLENAKAFLHPNPAFETYFDVFLALYVLPPLVNYEEDPELRSVYKSLLEGWFARNREINSPLVNFTYNWMTAGHSDLEQSIAFLQDAPLDLVDWLIDNGKREDLQIVRSPILEELQVNTLRPPSEYRTIRWDKNPYYAIAGNPHQEREPVYWLLPYWMGRYLGLIK